MGSKGHSREFALRDIPRPKVVGILVLKLIVYFLGDQPTFLNILDDEQACVRVDNLPVTWSKLRQPHSNPLLTANVKPCLQSCL